MMTLPLFSLEYKMPWKVYKKGDEYCVYKLNADGSKGEQLKGGCHASESEADDHMQALYASENKWLAVAKTLKRLIYG